MSTNYLVAIGKPVKVLRQDGHPLKDGLFRGIEVNADGKIVGLIEFPKEVADPITEITEEVR